MRTATGAWRPSTATLTSILVVLAVAGAGGFLLERRLTAGREDVRQHLRFIGGQKAARIVRWREDRLIEARFLSANADVARDAAAFLADPASEPARTALAGWSKLSTEAFASVSFFDARTGALRPVSVPKAGHRPHPPDELTGLVRAGQPALLDLHRDAPDAAPRMAMVCPVRAPGAAPGGGATLGALVLSIDPERFLYPLVREWPSASPTAETLLIRREGGQVLFLNDLRHRADCALELRLPIDPASQLPASMAALGREGLVEGDDYRGEPVLADVRAVPGSPWFMVAKVDQAELYAPLRREAWVLLGLTVAFALGAGLLVRHVQSGREAALLRAELEARRRAEEALREREEDLAITLESIGDAVIATDASGRVTRLNKVAEELTGWPLADARGRELTDVFRIVNEFSREPVESPVNKVLAEGAVVGLANHTVLIARDGRERPIADSGAPIRDADGTVRGVVLVFRDQTEQHRAEREMRTRDMAIAGAASAMAMADLDGRVTYVNEAFLRLWGYGSAEEATGRAATEFWLDPRGTHETLERVRDGGSWTGEMSARRKDGTVFAVEAVLGMIKSPSGAPICLLGSFLDATERRRAAAEREATISLLRLLNSSNDLHALMASAARFFQSKFDCQAVGIRLADGDDYPYFETRGFPPEFVRAESRLCVPAADGGVVRDAAGHPALECMCGNVLRGRFDPSKPFFTRRGSFWTNSTTELLASTSEADRQARTRNRCNGEGYESVALIPLRTGDRTFGLLQLNDRRRDRFTPGSIGFIEGLCDSLAIAMDQRRTQAELASVSSRREALLAAIPDIVMEVDAEKVYTWANRAGRDFFGDDVVGREAASYFEGEQETYRTVQPLFEGDDGVFYVESWQRRRDGRKRLLAWWCRALRDPSGKVVGALSSARDITGQRQVEGTLQESRQRLELAARSAGLGIWDWDIVENRMTWNDQMFRLYGVAERPAAYGFEIWENGLHPDDKAFALEACQAALRGEAPYDIEFRVRWPDGTVRHVKADGLVLRDEAGRAVRMLGVNYDITARKRAEARIREDLAEKEVLLREVHHRVKNNLQVISSLLGLQANILKDPEAKEAVGQSRDRVLAMARAYEGLYRSEDLQSIRLAPYLRNLVELMRQAYGAKPDQLTVDLADLAVDMDTASACGLIVNELLANAFKHAFPPGRPGSVRVELRTTGNEFELLIRDDGVGLPEASAAGKGGSLGLNLVSMLVRQLGGRLSVGGPPGAEFRMAFPLRMKEKGR